MPWAHGMRILRRWQNRGDPSSDDAAVSEDSLCRGSPITPARQCPRQQADLPFLLQKVDTFVGLLLDDALSGPARKALLQFLIALLDKSDLSCLGDVATFRAIVRESGALDCLAQAAMDRSPENAELSSLSLLALCTFFRNCQESKCHLAAAYGLVELGETFLWQLQALCVTSMTVGECRIDGWRLFTRLLEALVELSTSGTFVMRRQAEWRWRRENGRLREAAVEDLLMSHKPVSPLPPEVASLGDGTDAIRLSAFPSSSSIASMDDGVAELSWLQQVEASLMRRQAGHSAEAVASFLSAISQAWTEWTYQPKPFKKRTKSTETFQDFLERPLEDVWMDLEEAWPTGLEEWLSGRSKVNDPYTWGHFVAALSPVTFLDAAATVLIGFITRLPASPVVDADVPMLQSLQRSGLSFVLCLVKANPRNAFLLHSALPAIVQSLRNSDEDAGNTQHSGGPKNRALLCLLLLLIAQYHLSSNEAQMLLPTAHPSRPIANSNCVLTATSQTCTAHEAVPIGGLDLDVAQATHLDTLQLVNVLALAAEAPQVGPYFFFNGQRGHIRFGPFDSFPGPEVGYTFGCWVQSVAVPYLEAPLLTWVDTEEGVPAVVVLLREQVGKLGLGVRIHVPEEDTCESAATFTEATWPANGWHHLVMTHMKGTLSLFVDGRRAHVVHPTFYPSARGPTAHVAYLGCSVLSPLGQQPVEQAPGQFYGLIGTASLLHGALDPVGVRRWYIHAIRGLPAEHSMVAVAHPAAIPSVYQCGGCPSSFGLKLPTSATRQQSPAQPPLVTYSVDVEGHVVCHAATALQQLNFVPTVLRTLAQCPSRPLTTDEVEGGCPEEVLRVLLLRLLVSMVHHDAAAGVVVCAMHGFDHLYDAFCSLPLSIASMQVIIGLCSTGEVYKGQPVLSTRHLDGLHLLMDLFSVALVPAQQMTFLRLLSDLLGLSENVKVWKSGPGLMSILEVGRVCSPAFTTEVINVVEKLCRDSEELGVLLEFLLHAEFETTGGTSRTQMELCMFKEELVRLLYDVVRETPVMVDRLLNSGGMALICALLGAEREECRVLGVKLGALCLHINDKLRSKYMFFEVCQHLLARSFARIGTFNVLFKFALDVFRPSYESLASRKSAARRITRSLSWSSLSSEDTADSWASDETTSLSTRLLLMEGQKDHIVHPQVVRIIMVLLAANHQHFATSPADVHAVFSLVMQYFDRVLDVKENVDVLLEYSGCHWLDLFWIVHRSLPCSKPPSPSTHETTSSSEPVADGSAVDFTAQGPTAQPLKPKIAKLLLADLRRVPKYCTVGRLKAMVDAPNFQALVLGCLVAHFQSNSSLAGEAVPNTLQNLGQLLAGIEEAVPLPSDLTLSLIHTLGLLAVQNTPEVRRNMKTAGLFEARDRLALHLVKTATSLAAFTALTTLNFQPCFQEEPTWLILLRRLHNSEGDVALQMAVVDMMRTVYYHEDEQRCHLTHLLCNEEIVNRLLWRSQPPGDAGVEAPWTSADFVQWYNAAERNEQRRAVGARLEEEWKLLDTAMAQQQERQRADLQRAVERQMAEQAKAEERSRKAAKKIERLTHEISCRTKQSYAHRMAAFHGHRDLRMSRQLGFPGLLAKGLHAAQPQRGASSPTTSETGGCARAHLLADEIFTNASKTHVRAPPLPLVNGRLH
eukprot:GGOE01020620.1.p1 GENE.GGOE01020620.1~~GGOE01020620.1.p1  ORF type:complete len:1655 (-),score=466.73 GGOE01020620.1:362-5326(-)